MHCSHIPNYNLRISTEPQRPPLQARRQSHPLSTPISRQHGFHHQLAPSQDDSQPPRRQCVPSPYAVGRPVSLSYYVTCQRGIDSTVESLAVGAVIGGEGTVVDQGKCFVHGPTLQLVRSQTPTVQPATPTRVVEARGVLFIIVELRQRSFGDGGSPVNSTRIDSGNGSSIASGDDGISNYGRSSGANISGARVTRPVTVETTCARGTD